MSSLLKYIILLVFSITAGMIHGGLSGVIAGWYWGEYKLKEWTKEYLSYPDPLIQGREGDASNNEALK